MKQTEVAESTHLNDPGAPRALVPGQDSVDDGLHAVLRSLHMEVWAAELAKEGLLTVDDLAWINSSDDLPGSIPSPMRKRFVSQFADRRKAGNAAVVAQPNVLLPFVAVNFSRRAH